MCQKEGVRGYEIGVRDVWGNITRIWWVATAADPDSASLALLLARTLAVRTFPPLSSDLEIHESRKRFPLRSEVGRPQCLSRLRLAQCVLRRTASVNSIDIVAGRRSHPASTPLEPRRESSSVEIDRAYTKGGSVFVEQSMGFAHLPASASDCRVAPETSPSTLSTSNPWPRASGEPYDVAPDPTCHG